MHPICPRNRYVTISAPFPMDTASLKHPAAAVTTTHAALSLRHSICSANTCVAGSSAAAQRRAAARCCQRNGRAAQPRPGWRLWAPDSQQRSQPRHAMYTARPLRAAPSPKSRMRQQFASKPLRAVLIWERRSRGRGLHRQQPPAARWRTRNVPHLECVFSVRAVGRVTTNAIAGTVRRGRISAFGSPPSRNDLVVVDKPTCFDNHKHSSFRSSQDKSYPVLLARSRPALA
jgi:hypothetical protein